MSTVRNALVAAVCLWLRVFHEVALKLWDELLPSLELVWAENLLPNSLTWILAGFSSSWSGRPRGLVPVVLHGPFFLIGMFTTWQLASLRVNVWESKKEGLRWVSQSFYTLTSNQPSSPFAVFIRSSSLGATHAQG